MRKKGFTLVEIMIVIAIIIVLVAIAIAAGDAAKKVARDNQRKTDITLLQLKLEAYRGQNGLYPGTNGLGDLVTKSFVSALPKDPANGNDYQYIPLQFSSGACGTSYELYATLENKNNDKHVTLTNGLSKCGGTLPATVDGSIYDVTSPQ